MGEYLNACKIVSFDGLSVIQPAGCQSIATFIKIALNQVKENSSVFSPMLLARVGCVIIGITGADGGGVPAYGVDPSDGLSSECEDLPTV